MLTALTADRHRVVASVEVRTTGAFCPACACGLLVRIPTVRVAHFAHPPKSGCDGGAALRVLQGLARREALARRRAAETRIDGQQVLFELKGPLASGAKGGPGARYQPEPQPTGSTAKFAVDQARV